MADPRPDNEPRPRVEPQQSLLPIPGAVLAVLALALGVVWLVVFVVHLANGVGANWLDTWWPLVTGVAFLALGADRLRRERRRP